MTKISEVVEFLYESNLIESEPSGQALFDSVKAWEYLNEQKQLSTSIILQVHNLLMENINPRVAGRIRLNQVSVGGRLGVNPAAIGYKLVPLVQKEPKTEEEIKQWHIEFEHIHPFEDGNGRTGRIIMNWQRVKNGLPILIIHEGEEQFDYYTWFREDL